MAVGNKMLTYQKVRYGCLLFITALFISGLSWFLYLANAGVDHIVFALMRQIPYGDKICHIGVYGMLALLLNLSLRCRKIDFGLTDIYLGSFLAIFLVGLEEISQLFMPTRTYDWWDFIASCIGIFISASLTPCAAKAVLLKNKGK